MAAALSQVLTDATDSAVSVFPSPPGTFNPPALIVQFPTSVLKHVPAFGIDSAQLTVLAATGVLDTDGHDQLLEVASAALEANQTLNGAVQVLRPTEWRAWRVMTVSGIDLLVAEIAVDVRM